jgi:outer membrane receptor protein involved in Fe transport
VGAEYRHESTFSDNDPLTNATPNLNIGNQTNDLKGEFDVKEVFGELNVPLVRDSFIEYFGVTGAARYSDYSTIGKVFSWHAGAEFEPISGLRFRGVYAVANRAPNIGELFTQPNETFATVSDPCNGTTATNNPGVSATFPTGFGAQCRAIPGVAAAIASTGTFSYTLAQLQSINGFVGGNTALQEETAKTLTLGAVFVPRGAPYFNVSVDYYDIKVEDAIGTLGRTFSIQQCLQTNNPVFCSQVTRNPQTGFVTQVNGQLINVAKLRTRGIDLGSRYSRALGLTENDRVDFSLNVTRLLDFETQGNPVAPVSEFRGIVGTPDWRGTTRLAYTSGPFTVSHQMTYIHEVTAGLGGSLNNNTAALDRIPAYLYHDLQGRWDLGPDRNYSFFVNIDNLFDKAPPFLPGPPFSSNTGTETLGDVYDPFGRRFTAGARIKF